MFALNQAEEFFAEKYDNVIQLMANCPIRDAACIKDMYDEHCRKNHEFSISCFKFGWMNPWWALKKDQDGRGERVFEGTFVRSQDLPDLYCPTGAIWIAQTESLKRDQSFYGEGHRFLEIPWQQAVDIDSAEDLVFATCVAEFIKQNKQ